MKPSKRKIMTLEQQVCSLELSKELREAGYPQEGLWWWCKYKVNNKFQNKVVRYGYKDDRDKVMCVAPTATELGEVLPKYNISLSWKQTEIWCINYTNIRGIPRHSERADTEANARAKMWLYLKKKGLL